MAKKKVARPRARVVDTDEETSTAVTDDAEKVARERVATEERDSFPVGALAAAKDAEEEEEVDDYVDNDDRTERVFDGKPIEVHVGDVFYSKGNPGARIVVTPEVLADLIRRKKALAK